MELMPFRVHLKMVPEEMIRPIWPVVLPFLKAAEAENCPTSTDEWLGDALNGRVQLWVAVSDVDVVQGAGITRLVVSPKGKMCMIEAFGAKRGNDDMLEIVERWAKAEGCLSVRVYGRVGWMRRLKKYKVIGVILDREV